MCRGTRILDMPPNEPCPHCGQLIRDWHNEWYETTQRMAIFRGQAAMDCPLCRQPVLWVQSRNITSPPSGQQLPVYERSAAIAAQWVPIREPNFTNLAGYIANHPAGQHYRGYWTQGEVDQADGKVAKP